MTISSLIDLNLDKPDHYLLMINLERCGGSCDGLSSRICACNKICVPNKTEDVNLNIFNMITQINESKVLKNIFHVTVGANLAVENVIEIKIGITISVDVSAKIQ